MTFGYKLWKSKLYVHVFFIIEREKIENVFFIIESEKIENCYEQASFF